MNLLAQGQAIPVFFSCDEKYVPYVATAIKSLVANTKSLLHVYVIDGGITQHSKNLLKNFAMQLQNVTIDILFVDLNIFRDMKVNQLSLSSYCRFLIPWLVPELSRAIYLDADILVLGDIADLYNYDLRGKPLAACVDMGREPRSKLLEVNPNYFSFASKHVYFNAGVLLIDCEHWRKENLLDTLLAIEAKYREDMIFMDQDVLNKCFESNYVQLPIKFNFMPHMKELCKQGMVENVSAEDVKNAEKCCQIIHFAGPVKPWSSKWCFTNGEFENFWFYAYQTPSGIGMLANFVERNIVENVNRCVNDIRWSLDHFEESKKKYKILNVIPFLTVKKRFKRENRFLLSVSLLGLPLYSKLVDSKNVRYRLFGCFPLMKVTRK